MANLIHGLIVELNRNREILKLYEEIPQGAFGAIMIKESIAKAEKAMAVGDVVEMLQSYQELKGTK